MIPTSQPDSLPFLLVRPNPVVVRSDLIEDDAETTEIPSSKSVPPHSPPVPVNTTEHELPSVIVDASELQPGELAELQRATDVDGLLRAAEVREIPITIDDDPDFDALPTRKSVLRPGASGARSARTRGFAIAAVAALTAAGGTFAGLKAAHVSLFSLRAASHLVR